MYFIGIFINIFIFIAVSLCIRYDNYTLFRATPLTEKQLGFFKNLSEKMTIDFWREAGSLKKPVDFIISPESKEEFLRHAKNNKISLTPVLYDVQAAFDKQTVSSYVRRNMHSFNWASYYRLDDIYEWLQDLVSEYPNIVKVKTIGNTEERRNIKAVKVVHKTSESRKDRPKVIIEGGIHAREWVSISFVTYLLDRIVKAPLSSDIELKEISLLYEWYFVPVINPDGYEYSHTKDRSWRKNRGQDGFGVDLNRNFGVGFGTVGVSQTKTSPSYCGPSAFSERETSAMRGYVNALKNNLKYYLAFHNYGQAMIIPYAHLKEHMDNYDEVRRICLAAKRKLSKVHGTQYVVGTAYETIGYRASGVSGCWVKKRFKVPYVVLFELRDEGKYGFALPPRDIEPTCEETLEAVKKKLCNAAADRLFEIHHSKYTVGNTFETLGYVTSGLSEDWVKKTHHVPTVLEIRLGDAGRYGLAVPSNDILTVCEETMEGLKTILRKRDDTVSKRSTDEEEITWGKVEFVKQNRSVNVKIQPKVTIKPITAKNDAKRNTGSVYSAVDLMILMLWIFD